MPGLLEFLSSMLNKLTLRTVMEVSAPGLPLLVVWDVVVLLFMRVFPETMVFFLLWVGECAFRALDFLPLRIEG